MASQRISQNFALAQAEYECSYTQVSTFELCNRKWAWEWLDGLRAPKSDAAAFGISGHGILERWFKFREPPPPTAEGRVAQMMLKVLPAPQSVRPENVERDAGLQLAEMRFIQGVDIWMPSFDPPWIYDHKFTGSFDWSLTPEKMPDDVQATLYAAWALVVSGSPVVNVQWTYGLRKGAPKAMPVRAQLTAPLIEDRVGRTVESARSMRSLLDRGARAMDVPYNPLACEAYGGCHYQDRCNLSPQDRMRAIINQGLARLRVPSEKKESNEMTSPNKDYLEMLRQKRANNGAGAAVGAINPPPVAATEQPPVQQQQAAPAPAAADVAASDGKRSALQSRLRGGGAPAQQVVQQPPPQQQVVPPPPPQQVVQPPPPQQAPPQPIAQQVAQPPPQATAAPAPEQQAAAPRGRGRPAGSATKVDPSAERWASFAISASAAMIANTEPANMLDEQVQQGVASAAAAYADTLMLELLERFPS